MLRIAIYALASAAYAGVNFSGAGVDGAAPSYVQLVQTWRDHRATRLQAADGWLTLVGLEWLKDGNNTLGSAKGNSIVLTNAPAHLGTIALDKGVATVTLEPASGATIDGAHKPSAVLVDDSKEKPTTVSFGTESFYLVQRGDKYGLRIKDSAAPTRTHFLGLDYFDIDPSWRVEATWEAYNPPHEIEESNILGQIDKVVVPGAATFVHGGQTFRVEPIIEVPGDTQLFLVFADRTSGKETYGAARFVYADMPKDGKITLDFNKAYNPPCAFTAYATCPLPTAQNRLATRVTAGEKKYRGAHAEAPLPVQSK